MHTHKPHHMHTHTYSPILQYTRSQIIIDKASLLYQYISPHFPPLTKIPDGVGQRGIWQDTVLVDPTREVCEFVMATTFVKVC